MTLSPDDLAAIRERAESSHMMEIGAHQTGQTTIAAALTDRRKLLEHIAEMHTAYAQLDDNSSFYVFEAKALQARIDQALKLHKLRPPTPSDIDWCMCGVAWPCATVQALEGRDST